MRLGVPPSPSVDTARRRAEPLAAALAARGSPVEIVVAESYASLGDLLLGDHIDLAWAPPIVCARVEAAGGSAVLRAVRHGSTSYRAGLACRAGPVVDLTKCSLLVAAWVDENSAAGYLLARSWLAARHVDAMHGFKRAIFCGSYVSALQAVAEGLADVTSVFTSVAGAPLRSTLDEVDAALRARVQIFAHTADTQTDGIVLPPGAKPRTFEGLLRTLQALHLDDVGRRALRGMLACDELRAEAPRPTSAALQAILTARETRR